MLKGLRRREGRAVDLREALGEACSCVEVVRRRESACAFPATCGSTVPNLSGGTTDEAESTSASRRLGPSIGRAGRTYALASPTSDSFRVGTHRPRFYKDTI